MSIYRKFADIKEGENGAPKKISLHYPDNFNFGYDVVDAIAEEEPDKRAIVWCNTEKEEKIFSFADVKRESNKFAAVLKKNGVKKGDKVLLVLKRHYEFWFASVALHKLGAVMIPATHMLTEKDFAYRINAARIKAVICTCRNSVPEKIKKALEITKREALLWSVGDKDYEGFRNLKKEAEAESGEFNREDTKVTDPMMLYFTSGTTGDPKGVIHDFSYPLAHIVTAKYWQEAFDGGLHFTVAETGWAKASWGKIYGQWLLGSAVMVYDFDNFDPKMLTNIINRYGVTSFCAPPTVYRYLVRKGIPDMPTLKHATTAGEMLSPEVFKRFKEKTGLALYEGYGQTETTLLLANFKGEEPSEGSMGKPSPLYNIKLLGKDGAPVGVGEIGEVVIVPEKGKNPEGVFTGYLDNTEQYESAWRGGVYHTGDAAYFDENGVFWFHGRFDDIIKTGGFRVGPYEVENILMEHPAVLECSVIGVPDPLRGQAIKAIVVLNSGYKRSKELEMEIKDFCNRKLAEYKWIRILEFSDEMPKTISGKIQKNVQRSEG